MVRWLATGLGVVLLASTSFAHSAKEGTEPEDGAVLDAAPPEITLHFDEAATLTRVSLTRTHDGASDEARLDAPRVATDEAILGSPDLGPGLYTVEWRALSGDGHAINGAFSFTVGGD